MFQGQGYETVIQLSAEGVSNSSVEMKYWKQGDTALTTRPVNSSEWTELEAGLYILKLPNDLFTTLGSFALYLTGPFEPILIKEYVEPAPVGLLTTPDHCIVSGNLADLGGNPAQSHRIVFRIAGFPRRSGSSLLVSDRLVTYADAQGNFSARLVRGSTVIIEIDQAGIKNQIEVPNQPTALLLDLLPSIP
ncbi:MAG: hypothetical protein EBZ49_00130 [Proteobacteria bacterium]|nr:hypothetical protein [Pseudomonadota bacterium]